MANLVMTSSQVYRPIISWSVAQQRVIVTGTNVDANNQKFFISTTFPTETVEVLAVRAISINFFNYTFDGGILNQFGTFADNDSGFKNMANHAPRTAAKNAADAGTFRIIGIRRNSAGVKVGITTIGGTSMIPVSFNVPPPVPTPTLFFVGATDQPLFSWSSTGTTSSHRIHRSTDGVNFTFIEEVPSGTTFYQGVTLNIGDTYYYKIERVSLGRYSDFSNTLEVAFEFNPPILDSVIFSPTNVDMNISWTNNSNVAPNFIVQARLLNGVFQTIANVTGTTVTHEPPAINFNEIVEYRVANTSGSFTTPYSSILSDLFGFTVDRPLLTDIDIVQGNNNQSAINIDWNPTSADTSIFQYIIQRSLHPAFQDFTEFIVGGNITTFTDLSPLTDASFYYYQIFAVARGVVNIPTDSFVFTNSIKSNTLGLQYFAIPEPPTGLTATLIYFDFVDLSWVNNYNANDRVGFSYVLQYKVGNTWVDFETINDLLDEFRLDELDFDTSYTIRIIVRNDVNGLEAWSGESIDIKTLRPPSGELVSNPITGITNSSCGGSDGSLQLFGVINFFYNLTLTDLAGDEYTATTDLFLTTFTGLTSGWYFLEMEAKNADKVLRGIGGKLLPTNSVQWIKVGTNNSTLSGSTFTTTDEEELPIELVGSGSTSTNLTVSLPSATVETFIYSSDKVLLGSFNGAKASLSGFKPQKLYIYSIDINGCTYLEIAVIKCLIDYSLGGIQRIYIAEWDNTFSANYDNREVMSFSDFDSTWYELPNNTINSFTQSYNKNAQGIYMSSNLSITLQNDGTIDWEDMVFILDKRWVIVLKDNNGRYWVFGQYNGATSDVIGRSTGEINGGNNVFTIVFTDVNGESVLSGINKTYVINNIV